MSLEFGGKINFCINCKRLIDYALNTKHKNHLYIQINKEVPPPNGRITVPVCEVCHKMLTDNITGVDGFIISHEIPR
jgi:hypothetical protein